MLLSLFHWLSGYVRAFAVFDYLSLRAVLAALTALVIGLAFGPFTIRELKKLHFGQAVRTDGPKSHLKKDGTPTMGGILILASIAISTLLWVDLSNRYIWVVLLVTLGYGWIGWADDYRKVVNHDPHGMSAREKFGWQSLIGIIVAVYLSFAIQAPADTSTFSLMWEWVRSGFTLPVSGKLDFTIPFFRQISFPFGMLGFIILTYFVLVGTSNAVNLTDGLDGLAVLPCVMVGSALGIFAYCVGRPDFASYLLFHYIPGAGELVVFCGAMAGAGLAFLWFNCHPAEVFMGDVGALALGGALWVLVFLAGLVG